MKPLFIRIVFFAFMAISASQAFAEDSAVPERVLGKKDAPVTVDEYVSLTCSHCADFYNNTLPDLEKAYVDAGKVRFILHDYVMDNVGLKASTLARCMPEEQYYPFIKVLYKNQSSWATSKDVDKTLIQYAKLGGLSEEKANACLQDTKLQDAITAERLDASKKVGVEATPTFVVNGKEIIQGAQPASTFTQTFDRLLNAKH